MHRFTRYFILSLLAGAALQAAIFNREQPAHDDRVAAFRLFMPDGVDAVRAVVVLNPGLNGDGRGLADDAEWRAFATRNRVALLASYLKGGGTYYEAEVWTGRALLDELKGFATDCRHAELATAPLALWGHSAGGQFNYNFACWKPERTLAFIANKGAYYTARADDRVRRIPALWIAGGKDSELRINNITSRYSENRRLGALWGLAVEPGVDHGVGASKRLGMVFLEDAFALRLDAAGRLRAVDTTQGWLGDLVKRTITPVNRVTEGARNRSWLPGEATAQLWREITGGASAENAKETR